MKSFGLFFMVLLFCYSILFLFSVMTKKISLALGLTIASIVIGAMLLNNEPNASGIAPYIPFHYFQAPEVITNDLAITLDNFDFSLNNGIISLGAASFAVLAVSYILFVFQTKRG